MNPIGDEGISEFCKFLENKNNKLQSLILHECEIKLLGALLFFKTIKNCIYLKRLDLSKNLLGMGPHAVRSGLLSKSLQYIINQNHFPNNLEDLKFENCNLGDDEAHGIAEEFQLSRNL
jgi:hypothetical protein